MFCETFFFFFTFPQALKESGVAFFFFFFSADKYSQGVSISDTTEEINISLKGFVVYGISFTKGI